MIGYNFLLPELSLFLASCLCPFLRHKSFFALISVLVAFSLIIIGYSDAIHSIFHNLVSISPFSQAIKALILIFGCCFLAQFIFDKQFHEKQFVVFVLFSILGMMLTVSSSSLLSLYLALEMQSIPLYVLATMNKSSTDSSEAGVKYFVLSSLASAVMVYGMSIVFLVSANLSFESIFIVKSNLHFIGLILFVSGLLFKIGIVPFHSWLPDVYEGSPTISTSFFAIVSKISIVALLVAIFSDHYVNIKGNDFVLLYTFSILMQNVLAFLGVLSLFFGSLAAIGQKNIKRLIAFASVVHAGFILLGIASSMDFDLQNPGILYVIVYSVINLGLFSFILLLPNYQIKKLCGFAAKNKLIAASISALLLSSAGIPPFAGFFTKFYVITSLVNSNLLVHALLSLLAGAISVFYYLRIIKIMYFEDQNDSTLKLNDKSYGLVFFIVFTALLNTFSFIWLLF